MEKLVAATNWAGTRVLVTGHTGFKGAWLCHWLLRLGAKVSGLSLAPQTEPNLFALIGLSNRVDSRICDIRDSRAVTEQVTDLAPQFVFHLAAQALVRTGYREPVTTFASNTLGTAHVLAALRGLPDLRAIVVATTDKVYKNHEHLKPYVESDELGGRDPYSASKAAAEMVVSSFRQSYFQPRGVPVVSVRAGNVIGGGDWAEDRLIPDAVRAWSSNLPLEVRHPDAVRPWQHVLEPLHGYLLLAQRVAGAPTLVDTLNFGPDLADCLSVRSVVETARQHFGKGEVLWGNEMHGPHEAGLLLLDNSKARTVIGATPRWTTALAIERTLKWYRGLASGESAVALCHADFDAFERAE